MTEAEQIQAATNFSREWEGRGDEIQETYNFWYALFRDVFEIEKPEKIFKFQEPVKFDGTTHNIDLLIPRTKVLIEQKSFGVDLSKKYQQSDGEFLTPFEQAQRYAENLPFDMQPRWIVTCNFSEFRIYNLDCMEYPEKYRQLYFMKHAHDFNPPTAEDIENAVAQPRIVNLENLRNEFQYLNFIIDENIEMILPDVQISTAAAEIVKKIRDSFANNYEKNSVKNYDSLIYKICTRLVFCLYANDSAVFPKNLLFDYLNGFKAEDKLTALQKFFSVLNTKENLRDENLPDTLKNFKYVNGGLFAENFDLPAYKKYIESPVDTLLVFNANKNFSWHMINPTIFGAMFESTLNPETQRTGGMYYTSPENIHKVIDPLFLNRFHKLFKSIKRSRIKNRLTRFQDLQNKLASLKFLDPACGSGNFLTETYLSLRRLENNILREIKKFTSLPPNPIKVSIQQFYGIEINDFAVAVAQTALWIAENQMLQETEKFLDHDLNSLPLKNYPNIVNANALRKNWAEIVSPDDLNFIIGNPPFRGTKYQTAKQKSDVLSVCQDLKPLDYVCAWYKKADDFIKNTNIRCAFVSTNSVAQGEQVAPLWKILNSHIDFAHRTFKWQNESLNPSAAVHCVVIGFSQSKNKFQKIIFDGDKIIFAENINGYLQDAPNIYIEKRKNPLFDVPPMMRGNSLTDDGNFILSEDEKNYFIEKNPDTEKFIRPLIGAEEFLNGKKRYCLWLKDFSLDEIKKFPLIFKRVEKVKNFRLKSNRSATKKGAANPKNFLEIHQPTENFILVPVLSSENRRYIPMDFLSPEFIVTNLVQTIPSANIYHFGILQSLVHMEWLKVVSSRFKSDYRYIRDIVYNNFVWCDYSEKICRTAEQILSVRKKFDGWTLAKLYNEKSMPEELRAAHEENDRAVLAAYGWDENISESEIVRELMKLYKNLTSAE